MNQPGVHTCPSILNSPRTSLPTPSHGLSQSTCSECSASCPELALVIYFTDGYIHVSVLLSQIIPPSTSSTQSKSLLFTSVSLLLPCIWDHCYHLSKFHIYALIYSTRTENFQMFKLDLEKAEEPEIKLPTSVGSQKKGNPVKHLLHWLHKSLWLCGSQQTVENSSKDGNTRLPYLTPEKPVCRSRSNS